MTQALDTNAKALQLNLDESAYGTLAEIGGGQEVSRWFFRVGAAAGTVAKTMSAYDKVVSDAIYGKGERYVSRERIRSMLAHEFDLLVERLAETRGATTKFFAFADTVATTSFRGGNEAHGWIGLRFQHEPHAAPSDILLHVALRDPNATLQQQSLGVLGVNLIFGAYYQRDSMHDLLAGLGSGVTIDNLEVDVVDCTGPAFEGGPDARDVAIMMLDLGLTPAVVFDEHCRMDQPSSVFHKRAILVHRCSMKRENPELAHMLDGSVALVRAEEVSLERDPLRLLELATNNGSPEDEAGRRARRASIDRAFRPGCATMLTRFPETFRISAYLRRTTDYPVRFVLGLDSIVTLLHDHFYARVDGGVLEGLGRLLSPNTRLYVFPMSREVLAERLRLHHIEPEFWSAPDRQVLCADDITLAQPSGHLLGFLRSAGWLISAPATHSIG